MIVEPKRNGLPGDDPEENRENRISEIKPPGCTKIVDCIWNHDSIIAVIDNGNMLQELSLDTERSKRSVAGAEDDHDTSNAKGISTTYYQTTSLMKHSFNSSIRRVSTGEEHVVVVTEDGKAYGWGLHSSLHGYQTMKARLLLQSQSVSSTEMISSTQRCSLSPLLSSLSSSTPS